MHGISATAATLTTTVVPTVFINEVATMNLGGAADELGDIGDWVELYNGSAATVDLTGWGLSNTVASPFKWVFPSGSTIASKKYLRVWMDKADRTASQANLHTNFNIDNAVDPIALSAPNGTVLGQLVDTTMPARGTPNVTWCRMPSSVATSPFVACLTPTPAASNSGSTATGLLSTPTLSVPSGIYPAAQSVLATPGAAAIDSGSVLRYTSDGSAPTSSSAIVTGPIAVSASRSIVVAAFKAGVLTSYPVTGTYVIEPSSRFSGQRAMFVTMKPQDKTDFTGGLVDAPEKGWRTTVEMLAPSGARAFIADGVSEEAGQLGSHQGQATLPLEIKFKDAAGFKSVSYPIFASKPAQTTYKRLRLRNSGNDYSRAHLRDQFWQSLGTESRLTPAAYEPVQVFLNGKYYGMMDLREKEDEALVESSWGVDKDDVQYLSDAKVLGGEGTKASFDAMAAFITGNDMSVPANYAQATKLLAMQDFAADFALHMFAADRDWQNRNMQMFRMSSYDGRWRYRPHDFDISGDNTSVKTFFDTSPSTDMNSMYGAQTSAEIMKALLKNPTFKALYVNVIADQLNSFLLPSESQPRLDTMAASMAPYIGNQIAENGKPTSYAFWQGEIGLLRTFLSARVPFYLANTQTYLGLGVRAPVTVGVSDPSQGTVSVGSVNLATRLTPMSPTWTGQYWPTVPVTVTALPKVGYAFAGWSDGATTPSRQVVAGSGTPYVASFTPLISVPSPTVTPWAPTQSLTTGVVVDRDVVATDPNNYPLTYSAKTLPKGIDIHPVSGKLYGKPSRAGTYASVITVSNGPAKSSFSVTFTVVNQLDRVVTLPTRVTGDGLGLTAVYSNDAVNGGTSAKTQIQAPAINVGWLSAPFSGFATDNWSVRFTGYLTAPITGNYTLTAAMNADDGVRLIVNGITLFDTWPKGVKSASGQVAMTAGQRVPFTLEFVDKSMAANLVVSWVVPGETLAATVPIGMFDPT